MGSEAGEGGRAAGGHGRDGAEDGTAGKEGEGRRREGIVGGIRQRKYGVDSDESFEKDKNVGKAHV